MNLECPHVIAAAKEVYDFLAKVDPPRKPWERLAVSKRRIFLIIGKHIMTEKCKRFNDAAIEHIQDIWTPVDGEIYPSKAGQLLCVPIKGKEQWFLIDFTPCNPPTNPNP